MRQRQGLLPSLAVAAPTAEPEFRRLLDDLPGGAYTCNAEGLITYYNRRAAELWGREPKLNDPGDRFSGSFKLFSTQGRPLSHDECWMALTLKNDRAYNEQEIVIERPDGTRLTVLAHANPIHDDTGKVVGSVNVLVNITAQKDVEEAVHDVNRVLTEEVAHRTEALSVLRDVAIAANEAESLDDVLLVALRRVCDYNGWLVGHAWRRDTDVDDEFVSSRVWHFATQNESVLRSLEAFREITDPIRIPLRGGFIGRVARTTKPSWYDDVTDFSGWLRGDPRQYGLTATIAFPVWVRGKVVAALEFFSRGPLKREERFMETMCDVGVQLGRVFERKRLEKAVADATAEQQQRISRELHDTVSQLLTGVSMMGESLRQALDGDGSPHIDLATKLVHGLDETQQQVRRVSRGLMPVELDAAGLMTALGELAERCVDLYSVPCVLVCPEPVMVQDKTVAFELYYIASEALHNAVKHARPKKIALRLDSVGDSIRLVIEDDGVGIDESTSSSSSGMGRSIMRYRASVIDAKLETLSGAIGGTKVVCTAPRKL